MIVDTQNDANAAGMAPSSDRGWSYHEAFSRNFGLISHAEQATIRNCRVAIAGMGGVGGLHLITLVRLGFSRFSIADPDEFSVANFNRQYGASVCNLQRNKAEVMAEAALKINPDADIDFLTEPVNDSNVNAFVGGCKIYVDGLDFFAIKARRLLFNTARQRRIWAITAGPIGFSAAWLTFGPSGMSFDQYFDLNDRQSRADQLIAFAVGLTPKATHRAYTDLSGVKINEGVGPSVSLACQLASGVASAEALKIALGRGKIRTAPYYAQFDPYCHSLKTGRLHFGNRHPFQLLKRQFLKRYLQRNGVIPHE